MCGLAGIVGPGRVEEARPLVQRMIGAMRHRGPDGEGSLERAWDRNSLVLCHRRLAIIDLSAAGAQPMRSTDGTLHLILNGEIYNHVELREELTALGHRFRSRSDTEVLVEAWAEWGRGALDRVEGMFAFALLDERRRTVTLARDQFAMKPLYFARSLGRLAFASEIPPLLALPGVGRRADACALADFVARAVNNHPGRTLFADVSELPGAHLAEIPLDDPTRVEPLRYWRPPERQRHDLSLAEAAAGVRARLERSVRLHLRSDVPVGVLLSGGQDSSAITALARHVLGPDAALHTFSFRGGGEAFDEGPFIDAARAATGAIGHEIAIGPDDWAHGLPALVAAQGEPFGSPVIFAQRKLFEAAAANGVRVVLDGQASDEYLAGYDRFRPARIATLLRRGALLQAVRVARGYARGGASLATLARQGLRLALPALPSRTAGRNAPLLDPGWLRRTGASLSELPAPPGPDVLRSMLASSLHTPSLPWLLRYADRNAMSFSVENRLPFLNTRLVEFVLGLPERHFIADDGQGKQLLRLAVQDLVPPIIRERRTRVGFHVPLGAWLRSTPGVVEHLRFAESVPGVSGGRARHLRALVERDGQIPTAELFELWRLVLLSLWVRAFDVAFA